MESIFRNEIIGAPTTQGFTVGDLADFGPFQKADYAGMRAIRVNGQLILANDLTEAETFSPSADALNQSVTFSNTTFNDLDVLGENVFTRGVAVTVDTGTQALVVVSANVLRNTDANQTLLSYRVSGATTNAADAQKGARSAASTQDSHTFHILEDGLNPGSNTFELQARVTAGAGGHIIHPALVVVPLWVEVLY